MYLYFNQLDVFSNNKVGLPISPSTFPTDLIAPDSSAFLTLNLSVIGTAVGCVFSRSAMLN
jgi:hypothetical protein